MNKLKITIYDDKKEKRQSFEVTADFEYTWNEPYNGYGGEFSMTAFGSTEQEARERLKEELCTFHDIFKDIVKGL